MSALKKLPDPTNRRAVGDMYIVARYNLRTGNVSHVDYVSAAHTAEGAWYNLGQYVGKLRVRSTDRMFGIMTQSQFDSLEDAD